MPPSIVSTPPFSFVQFSPPDITDRKFWEEVKKHPSLQPYLQKLEKCCQNAVDRPPIPHASDYLAAKRSNDRSPLDRHWREDRLILSALTMNRLLNGMPEDGKDDRLLNWFWAYFTLPTWCASSHLPKNDLPLLGGTPLLDLAACEFAVQFAETRELLKPWMDANSETLANSIVHEIAQRILTPYGDGIRVGWEDPLPGKFFNNWIGVCGGSILATCESLARQGFAFEKARARALKSMDTYLHRALSEHGESDEGITYWLYGMEFACAGLSRLDPETFEQNINTERLKLVADYPRRAHLFENHFFSCNDSSFLSDAAQNFVPWLGHVTQSDFLKAWSYQHPNLERDWTFSQMVRTLYWNYTLPPSFSSKNLFVPAPRLLEDQQAAIVELKNGQLWACLTGGHNAERHNHNDLGHFMIAHKGKWIIPDLGLPIYPANFFGPKRYTYTIASSRGHNCPVIHGQEQRGGHDAKGKILSWKEDQGRLELDLTAAYPTEALLLMWHRILETSRDSIKIIDYFETAKPNISIQHCFWSVEKLKSSENKHHFELGDIKVTLNPPLNLHHETFQMKDLLLLKSEETKAFQVKLHNTFLGNIIYRIQSDYQTDQKGELQIETCFRLVH